MASDYAGSLQVSTLLIATREGAMHYTFHAVHRLLTSRQCNNGQHWIDFARIMLWRRCEWLLAILRSSAEGVILVLQMIQKLFLETVFQNHMYRDGNSGDFKYASTAVSWRHCTMSQKKILSPVHAIQPLAMAPYCCHC